MRVFNFLLYSPLYCLNSLHSKHFFLIFMIEKSNKIDF